MMNLEKIKEKTNAEIVMLSDLTGKVIEATGTEHEKNFALMTNTAFSMCNDILNDITKTNLSELIMRSEEHYIIASKRNEHILVLSAPSSQSNFALSLKLINNL